MAVDQDTLDLYDPQLAELKARVDALEARATLVTPDEYMVVYPNGDVLTYKLVP